MYQCHVLHHVCTYIYQVFHDRSAECLAVTARGGLVCDDFTPPRLFCYVISLIYRSFTVLEMVTDHCCSHHLQQSITSHSLITAGSKVATVSRPGVWSSLRKRLEKCSIRPSVDGPRSRGLQDTIHDTMHGTIQDTIQYAMLELGLELSSECRRRQSSV
jgi:hypothetical protein